MSEDDLVLLLLLLDEADSALKNDSLATTRNKSQQRLTNVVQYFMYLVYLQNVFYAHGKSNTYPRLTNVIQQIICLI